MNLTPELDAALRECLHRFDVYDHADYHADSGEWVTARSKVLDALARVYDIYNVDAWAQGLPLIEAYRGEGSDNGR